MSPPNRMLTIQLVTLVWSFLVSSLALAYTTGSQIASSNRPFLHSLDLHDIQSMQRTTVTTHFPTKEEPIAAARRRYDLGIGKNPPLVSRSYTNEDGTDTSSSLQLQGDHMISHQHHLSGKSSSTTTAYLVEHEATREYPSPTTRVATIVLQTKPQQQRLIPKVQHERRVKDVLQIDHYPRYNSDDYHSSDHVLDQISSTGTTSNTMKSSSSLLPLIRASSKVQLDVNTVWVEMMLHSEHIKSVSMVPSAVV